MNNSHSSNNSNNDSIRDNLVKSKLVLLKEALRSLKRRKDLLPLGIVIILISGIIITLALIRDPKSFLSRASLTNSSIDLAIGAENSNQATLGEIFEVPVMINTDDGEIAGADIVINFDKDFLQLTDIIQKAENTPFNKFLPAGTNGNFDNAGQVLAANTSGVVDFSALSYSGNQNPPLFQGILGPTNPLAILKFKALKEGSTTINVSFNSTSTGDSNLISKTSGDILGKVTNYNLNISQATPPPTGTETITLTTIDDGYSINRFGHNETSTLLRTGAAKYASGFRFTLPLTAGTEIVGANLKIYSEYTSAPTTVSIKAEKSLSSNPFSGKNTIISNRTYFPDTISWDITGDNTEITSPDIKSLIAGITNQTNWKANNNITLSLLNSSGLPYTSISSKENSNNKATKLVITYKLAPTPTPTPVPPPPPNIKANVPCAGGQYSKNEVTISWTNNATPVEWVDISPDPKFATWYHKKVQTNSGENASTSGPEGFTDSKTPTKPLVARTGTTYYARTWNGSFSQGNTGFKIDSCPVAIITSPTPSSNKGTTISVTTIDDGYSINGFGHNETSTLLRTGGGKYDAGFSFALPIPAKSQIIEAKLIVYTQNANSSITNIRAEKSLNTNPLSKANSYIPNRSYFDNSISWNMTGNQTSLTSPDLKDLIQNIVNQDNWKSGSNILIALLKSNSSYASIVSKEGDNSKAATLIIRYQ